MKKILSYFSISVILMIIACASTNKYMIKASSEFGDVTKHFIGEWAVTSYEAGGNNLLDNPYEKAKVTFDFDTRKVKYEIWVSETYLSEKMLDWKKKYPDLKVDEYRINLTADWNIGKGGEILYIDNKIVNLVLKGSGENFEGFYGWERTKLEATKSVGKGGGLAGLAASFAAKKVTGTSELFPPISSQYNFRFAKDKRHVRIYSITKNTLNLAKVD
ncbi:MAG: hypothetical protein KAV99_07020 [Candidatus Latescibacteria bacterium]|nr:hypothetical protein [Candidatus Latescibacterota bacterium]